MMMYNSDFKCSKCDEIFEQFYYAKEKEQEIECPFCQNLMEKIDNSNSNDYDIPKSCACEDWKDNIRILNTPYILNLTVVGHYEGKIFDYCPWCGERLK